jgi:hypothetical protein
MLMKIQRIARFSATAVLVGAGLLAPALAHAQDPTRPPTPPPSPTSPANPATPATPAPKTGTADGSIGPSLSTAACSITLDVASIHAGAPSLAVQASLSNAIGDSITASFPMASKIEVVNVMPSAAAKSVQLTLNTTDASPGDYTVSLKGTKGECRGKVKVAAQ